MPRTSKKVSTTPTTRPAWLDEKKRESGEGATFLVKDKLDNTFENNRYDDLWQITEEFGKKGQLLSTSFVDMSWLSNSALSQEEQDVIRHVSAQRLERGRQLQWWALSPLKALTSLDIEAFERVWKKLRYNGKIQLKGLTNALAEYKESRFSALHQAFKNRMIQRAKQNPYCPRSGALSLQEYSDIHLKMNQFEPIIMSETNFDAWLEEQVIQYGGQTSNQVTYLNTLFMYMSYYFSIVFGLRAEQIRLLKWQHFTANFRGTDATEPFLFEGEGYLWPLELKQQDDESNRPQTTPLLVPNEFSAILNCYRKIITKKLTQYMESSSYSLTKTQLEELFSVLPVILNTTIFDVASKARLKATSAEHVYQRLLAGNWYCSSDVIKDTPQALKKKLHFESFRLLPDEYNLNLTRMRHTKGTRMPQSGFSRPATAAALTHLGIGSVSIYFDVTPEQQAELDDARGDTDLLISAAEGHFEKMLKARIIDEMKEHEDEIFDLDAGKLGKRESLPMCRGCTETKPLSCYGCTNFKPLLTADHNQFLMKVEQEYQEKQAFYKPHQMQGLTDMMLKIKLTIKVCNHLLDGRHLPTQMGNQHE